MLEEQLARARTRVEYTVQLEADILSLKQTINELSLVCFRKMKLKLFLIIINHLRCVNI